MSQVKLRAISPPGEEGSYEGFLKKRNGLDWQKRWVRVRGQVIEIFVSSEKMPIEMIQLSPTTTVLVPNTFHKGSDLVFNLQTPSQTHTFCVESKQAMLIWVVLLRKACNAPIDKRFVQATLRQVSENSKKNEAADKEDDDEPEPPIKFTTAVCVFEVEEQKRTIQVAEKTTVASFLESVARKLVYNSGDLGLHILPSTPSVHPVDHTGRELPRSAQPEELMLLLLAEKNVLQVRRGVIIFKGFEVKMALPSNEDVAPLREWQRNRDLGRLQRLRKQQQRQQEQQQRKKEEEKLKQLQLRQQQSQPQPQQSQQQQQQSQPQQQQSQLQQPIPQQQLPQQLPQQQYQQQQHQQQQQVYPQQYYPANQGWATPPPGYPPPWYPQQQQQPYQCYPQQMYSPENCNSPYLSGSFERRMSFGNTPPPDYQPPPVFFGQQQPYSHQLPENGIENGLNGNGNRGRSGSMNGFGSEEPFSGNRALMSQDSGDFEVASLLRASVRDFSKMDELVGTLLGEYEVKKIIDVSPVGTVHLGYCHSDGTYVSIRTLGFFDPSVDVGSTAAAIGSIQNFSHKNIVGLRRCIQLESGFHIVSDYLQKSCSLSQLLEKRKALPEPVCRSIIKEVLRGLSFLSSRKLLHLNLSSDNIKIQQSGAVKLGCFGVVSRLDQTNPSYVGWVAPEALQGRQISHRSDIWSVGILIFQMLTGTPTYFPSARPPLLGPPSSSTAQDFLSRCCQIAPERRYDVETLFKHPWMTQETIPHCSVPNIPLSEFCQDLEWEDELGG